MPVLGQIWPYLGQKIHFLGGWSKTFGTLISGVQLNTFFVLKTFLFLSNGSFFKAHPCFGQIWDNDQILVKNTFFLGSPQVRTTFSGAKLKVLTVFIKNWSYLRVIAGNRQKKAQKHYFCQIDDFEKVKFCTFSSLCCIFGLLSSKQYVLTPIMSKTRPKCSFLISFLLLS